MEQIDQEDVCEKVKQLQLTKRPEQRTAGWYAFRNERLTASDWGKILIGNKKSAK